MRPDILNPLFAEVQALKGVGPTLAKPLDRLGIARVVDLLFHLPLRYQDRTRLTPIAALRHGMDVVIEGVIAGNGVVFPLAVPADPVLDVFLLFFGIFDFSHCFHLMFFVLLTFP